MLAEGKVVLDAEEPVGGGMASSCWESVAASVSGLSASAVSLALSCVLAFSGASAPQAPKAMQPVRSRAKIFLFVLLFFMGFIHPFYALNLLRSFLYIVYYRWGECQMVCWENGLKRLHVAGCGIG